MISISICCGEKMAVMSFWPFHDDSQTDLNHGGFRKRRNCQNTITLAAFCPLECQHDSWEISRWIAQGRLRWSVHHRKKTTDPSFQECGFWTVPSGAISISNNISLGKAVCPCVMFVCHIRSFKNLKMLPNQGRRKMKNSGGASTKRPSATWAFGQTTTILNLGKSGGGASGPTGPPGSGGPVPKSMATTPTLIFHNF